MLNPSGRYGGPRLMVSMWEPSWVHSSGSALAAPAYGDWKFRNPLLPTPSPPPSMCWHSLCCVSGWLVSRQGTKMSGNGNLETDDKKGVSLPRQVSGLLGWACFKCRALDPTSVCWIWLYGEAGPSPDSWKFPSGACPGVSGQGSSCCWIHRTRALPLKAYHEGSNMQDGSEQNPGPRAPLELAPPWTLHAGAHVL